MQENVDFYLIQMLIFTKQFNPVRGRSDGSYYMDNEWTPQVFIHSQNVMVLTIFTLPQAWQIDLNDSKPVLHWSA